MRPPAPLAACSWSFQTDDPRAIAEHARAVGVEAVQLHLDTLSSPDHARTAAAALADAGVAVASGMMTTVGEDYSTLEAIRRTGGLRPDEHWPTNRAAARKNAEVASELGLSLVTLHAGFIPEDPADPERRTFLRRLADVADAFHAAGVRLGLETGQESAETLVGVLAELDRAHVGVNFDPANMLLYASGDPTEAFQRLAPLAFQMHIKDAVPSSTPGEWGEEVVVGTGTVDWEALFGLVDRACPGLPMAIEREAGESRVHDIRAAAEFVRALRPDV